MSNGIPVNINPSPFDWKFIVQNISNKDVRIFDVTLRRGQQINLVNIPFVSENDIKKSLFKGELLSKINSREIRVVSSNINLQSYSADFAAFCNNNNIPHSQNIASDSTYVPANPANWNPVPDEISEALDTLAANAGGGPGTSDAGKSFSGYSTQSLTLNQLVFLDINLSVLTITPGDIYTHTLNTPDVTVSKTGLYLIAYRASFDQTSGQRAISRARISVNGTGLDYTITYSYHRSVNTGEGTCAYADVFSLNNGDSVKLQVARQDTTGSPITLIPNSAGLSLNFLR